MFGSVMHLYLRFVLITLTSSNYPKEILGIAYISDIVRAVFRTQLNIVDEATCENS